MSEHTFHDPLSGRAQTLVISAGGVPSGVRHDACDHMAAVSADIDSAYCAACGWQARISGAWYLDLITAATDALDGRWQVERDRAAKVMAEDIERHTVKSLDEDDPAIAAGLAAVAELIGTFRTEPAGMAYIIGSVDAARARAGWVPWWMPTETSVDEPNVTTTDRGFKHLEPINDDAGGTVRICESSSAESPHLWLVVTERDNKQTNAHLSLEDAETLRDQLAWLIGHHYQVEQ